MSRKVKSDDSANWEPLLMNFGSETGAVQNPFVRYAEEAGWTYLSPEEAINLRQGGINSPLLRIPNHGKLFKTMLKAYLDNGNGDSPAILRAT